ncbi:hypothetical protein K1719_007255 [Acacia pycnantha]|nr:hypothetical protein K1719_007255 [Acacia pycnantha]
MVKAGVRVSLDHHPLIINTCPESDMRREKPFRFEAAWLKHNDFRNFLLKKWVRGGDVCGNIRVLKEQLGVWSKEVFGHIRYRIRGICRRLEGIQRCKIVWNLLAKPKGLCSQILKAKYGRGANWLVECIVMQHDSSLWKNVARLWLEVIKGELGMLNSTLTVSQTLNREGNWNWAWLEGVLPHEVTQLLKAIPPPCPEDGDDIVVWRGDRETAHNRLLTVARRARILGGVPTCSWCGGGVEDLDHDAWIQGRTRDRILNAWLRDNNNELQICFSHILREGNAVADWLAKHSFICNDDFTILDSLPAGVVYFLFRDTVGVVYPRLNPG